MNLIDAIKSGRPFRRRHDELWFAKYDGCLSERFRSGPKEDIHHELLLGDVIADDWEIQEPTVTITASQFWKAFEEAFNVERCVGLLGSTLQYSGTPPPYAQLTQMSRKLGLEPKWPK